MHVKHILPVNRKFNIVLLVMQEEEDEEPRVFEMPRSWVNYITISKKGTGIPREKYTSWNSEVILCVLHHSRNIVKVKLVFNGHTVEKWDVSSAPKHKTWH